MTARKAGPKAKRKPAPGRGAGAKRAARPKARAKGGAAAPLERLRAIIARLPETSERLSHGAPTFWGGKKTFASLADNRHGDGRVALWVKAPDGAQEALVEADPETFFVPPYVGPSGWLGVRLDRGPDWDVVAGLLEEGWRMVAPKRALRKLDGA